MPRQPNTLMIKIIAVRQNVAFMFLVIWSNRIPGSPLYLPNILYRFTLVFLKGRLISVMLQHLFLVNVYITLANNICTIDQLI